MGLDNLYGLGSVRPGVCTSTSRPGSPFEGQLIYETNTDLYKSWNGSTWVDVGVTPYAVASGGTESNITAYSVNYKLHTFTSSANLTISTGGFVDLLLVGAGGYGGGNGVSQGGGGGGGDLLFVHRQFLPAGTYTMTIGAGNATFGLQGNRTRFTSSDNNLITFIAYGGGSGSYGGGWAVWGGSSGGGGVYGGNNPPGPVHWANYGNQGSSASGANAGAGGGAGAAASGTTGGAGLDISLWLGQSAGTTYKGGGGAGTSGANGTGGGAANTGGGGPATSGSNAGYSGIGYVRTAR